MNLIKELSWRGMIQDIMPGTEEHLQKEMTTAYVGIDPTANSLHIGHLVSVMMLKHLQQGGHKPIALIGGATAMIGDPSGKLEERKLLSEAAIHTNEKGIQQQLEKFLDFTNKKNKAEIVNNNDWFKHIRTIDFLRDVGKHLTVNYLLSKGFVKDRMAEGRELSFTEFNYILMQAYDFMQLLESKNCTLQMGGSDQWGNITAGAELIRKKLRKEVFAVTCPLITKADGTKFGKTETGNIWLDPNKTSPYQFYQFWLNAADEDAKKWIKIFTFLSKDEIEQLITIHQQEPHKRIVQKKLAQELTCFVHSKAEYDFAVQSSEILFGNATTNVLQQLNEQQLLQVLEGIPTSTYAKTKLEVGIDIISFLAETGIFSSKSEARKALQGGAIQINKQKIEKIDYIVKLDILLRNKYLLVQKGKKNYYLVVVS